MGGMNFQLLIILLFFGFTALSWIVNKLREQAEVKRLRDEMRRREDESLRSTNVSRQAEADQRLQEGVKSPTQQRMEELAARRQAQLRELRERQAGETAQRRPTGGGVPGGGVVVRGPGQPTLRGPQGMPQGGGQRVPTGGPMGGPMRGTGGSGGVPPTMRQPGQQARPQTARQTAASQRDRQTAELRSAPPIRERERVVLRAAEASPIDASSPIEASAIGEGFAPGTPSALGRVRQVGADVRALLGVSGPERRRQQRALVAAAEVLGSPVALRDENELPWNRSSM